MYSIEITPPAEKQIRKLPKQVQKQVVVRAMQLTENPRPPGAKKLQGVKALYRIRQGDWRILYTIDDHKLKILVVKVGHRRNVYQR